MYPTLATEPKRADQVAEHIETLIVENELRPSQRLPPERELATKFGVSRTVIREAVRSLVAKGLLQVIHGSGTVVCPSTSDSATESLRLLLRRNAGGTSIEKLIEVRRVLEIEIAGLAAARRTPHDIANMQALVSAMVQDHNSEAFVANDVAFHTALAQAANNELFVVLLNSLADLMVEARQMAMKVHGATAGALKYHPAILDRVIAGDVTGAREMMRQHLVEAERTMRRAQSLHKRKLPRRR